MRPSRVLILSEVKALIDRKLSLDGMRRKLRCSSTALQLFFDAHKLETKSPGIGSNLARQFAKEQRDKLIPCGKGGDEAFAALMRGREYGRLIFPEADKREPIHMPHRVSGVDFSMCGSSMRHDSGSPGIHR